MIVLIAIMSASSRYDVIAFVAANFMLAVVIHHSSTLPFVSPHETK